MSRANALLVSICLLLPVAVQAEAIEAPDPELFEFLGEWDGEGEVWLEQEQSEEKNGAATPKTEVKQNGE